MAVTTFSTLRPRGITIPWAAALSREKRGAQLLEMEAARYILRTSIGVSWACLYMYSHVPSRIWSRPHGDLWRRILLRYAYRGNNQTIHAIYIPQFCGESEAFTLHYVVGTRITGSSTRGQYSYRRPGVWVHVMLSPKKNFCSNLNYPWMPPEANAAISFSVL